MLAALRAKSQLAEEMTVVDAGKAVDAKVVEEEDEEDDDDDYDETDEEASGIDDEDKMLDMGPDGSDFSATKLAGGMVTMRNILTLQLKA